MNNTSIDYMLSGYHAAMEKRDFSRIDKIRAIILDETTTQENYYDKIRKLTRNVKSDRGIGRWQHLADYYSRFVKNKENE